MQGSGDLCNPWVVLVINWQYSPPVALPPGLEWLLASPLGWWLWVSPALCCGLPKTTPWNGPCGSCYHCSYGFCSHLRQALPTWMVWSSSNWTAGSPPGPLHQWTSLGAPSHVEVPAHFLPVGKICLGLVVGLFLPNAGGPLCRPGSFEAASADSPGCQISYPGVARINPCPGNGVLVVQRSCSLLLRHGISILVSERCPHLSSKFLDVILAKNFLDFLPPHWHFHMLCVPVDPSSSFLGGMLRHQSLLQVVLHSIASPRCISSW